jgi:hypothetical protein
MDLNGEVGGDLVPPNPDHKPSGQASRVYLKRDGKLDEVLGRVQKAGGRIVRPKCFIPDADIDIIRDTEGNVVGLSSMKKK